MKLIVGLGNPGKKYTKTRHNVGFMAVDVLLMKLDDSVKWKLSKKFNAEVAEVTIKDEKIILAKPMTFMNRSGEAVGLIMHYYKINPEDLIVIHDDKDLHLGKYKIQANRGDAGHNGVKSIIEHISTKKFNRIRIGIAAENEKKMEDTPKFVLGKFGLRERKSVKEMFIKLIPELETLISKRSFQ